MSETTQQRIERIAKEYAYKLRDTFSANPRALPLRYYSEFVAALTAFAEEQEKEREDQAIELIMHQTFMDSLLDDLGAPKHPDNDPKRPKYGPYGRLKAYAESIGVKASMWQPLPPAPSTGEKPE